MHLWSSSCRLSISAVVENQPLVKNRTQVSSCRSFSKGLSLVFYHTFLSISAEREVCDSGMSVPDSVSAVVTPEASSQQWDGGAWALAWFLPLSTLRIAALVKL